MAKTIIVGLPTRTLSPNARVHWANLAKAKKAHRIYAKSATLAQVGQPQIKSYHLHLYWPDKRRRDRDNATAMCKAYLDGVADAVQQDDSEWDFTGVTFYVDKNNPRLEIEIEII